MGGVVKDDMTQANGYSSISESRYDVPFLFAIYSDYEVRVSEVPLDAMLRERWWQVPWNNLDERLNRLPSQMITSVSQRVGVVVHIPVPVIIFAFGASENGGGKV